MTSYTIWYRRIGSLLGLLFDLGTGASRSGLAAAEAFDVPPKTPAARRYCCAALVLFLSFSALLLSAGIAFTFAPDSYLHEILGWSGIACLILCILCGLRYAVMNNNSEQVDQ